MKQNKTNNKDGKINRTIKRYAPAVLGTLTSWMPMHVSQATPDNTGKWDKVATETVDNNHNLALAETGSANAYNQSIAQVSIDTEAADFANPAAVATGNGYYGQHQLGVSVNAGYNAQKYVAYALVYGSPEFKKSLADNLLTGTAAGKQRLIDEFAVSLEKFDEQKAPEKAYQLQNKAFQKLFQSIHVTPNAFRKAHADFGDEGKRLQSGFIYDVYLNLMPHNLKTITAQNPQVQFETIHPSILASVIAIAVKKGNGERFEKAINKASYTYYQQQAENQWQNDNTPLKSRQAPLAVASRKGRLSAENVVVLGDKLLRIYDEENSGLKSKDIITAPNYYIMIIRGKKPQGAHSTRDVKTFDTATDKAYIAGIINNKEWLKDYCGSFKNVYNKASSLLDKVPTLDTYYEISTIFNNPDLYHTLEKFYNQGKKEENIAYFNEAQKNYNKQQQRLAADFAKLKNLHLSEAPDLPPLMAVTAAEKHRQAETNSDKTAIIRRIMQNKQQRS